MAAPWALGARPHNGFPADVAVDADIVETAENQPQDKGYPDKLSLRDVQSDIDHGWSGKTVAAFGRSPLFWHRPVFLARKPQPRRATSLIPRRYYMNCYKRCVSVYNLLERVPRPGLFPALLPEGRGWRTSRPEQPRLTEPPAFKENIP